MAKNIATGIDIGTHQVRVVVAETQKGDGKNAPRVLGAGIAESKGLRHGYIINSNDVVRSIQSAVSQAEKTSGVRIRKAFISIGGIGLDEIRSRGETVVSRGDSEVTDLDIENAVDDSEKKISQKITNKKIIHVIPLKYKIDGQNILGKPHGMKGQKLEVETLFITCLEQHLNDLITAVEEAGVQAEDVMASPIAGSFVTLTRVQKIAGSVLANIGAETVSIVIFENNMPISIKVFPFGSTDITNDIALGLKIPIEEAERLKIGTIASASYSKKKLEEIIVARLSDIFELIETHLRKIGKNGLLPAGIILTGGGSGIATIEDLARASLKLPSRTASINFGKSSAGGGSRSNEQIKDSSWAVAYGLCIWGLTMEEESIGIKLAKRTGGNVLQWIKQFLP